MAWFLSGFVRQSLSFGGLARDGSNTSPGNSPFVAEQPWRSVTVHGSMAWPGGKIRGISEDALSWNVFVSLARLGILGAAIPELGSGTENVELYLWGNRIADGKPRFWDKLDRVRKTLEPGAAFPTEPDIMLRVPGHALVLIEAKFGSPNSTLAGKEDRFESVEDFLARYPAPEGAADPLARDWIEQQQLGTVLEQLCRNVVYATWLAEPREQPTVINLVRGEAEPDVETRLRPHLAKNGRESSAASHGSRFTQCSQRVVRRRGPS